jgi:hypothetical protein
MSLNYYKLFKTPKVHNPNFKEHGLVVPFRMLICGSTGSGKTNMLLDIIHKMSGTFKDIIICCRSADEPLYNYLQSKIPEGLTFKECMSTDDYPNLDELDDSTLVVFDDLVLEKNQSKIGEFFIRGRKKGISCIYISQSYFKTPKIIRGQCNYIALKKINSNKDLSLILSDFPLDITIDELKKIYQSCSKGIEQFLLIDVINNQFRCNYKLI